jgi:hypothetical protein
MQFWTGSWRTESKKNATRACTSTSELTPRMNDEQLFFHERIRKMNKGTQCPAAEVRGVPVATVPPLTTKQRETRKAAAMAKPHATADLPHHLRGRTMSIGISRTPLLSSRSATTAWLKNQ